jgi:hypothetical protein
MPPIKIRCETCATNPTAAFKCYYCNQALYCNENCLEKDWIAHRFFCKPEMPWETSLELALSGTILKGAKVSINNSEVFFFAIEDNTYEPTFSTIAECLDDINDHLLNQIKQDHSINVETIKKKLKEVLSPTRKAAIENAYSPLIFLLDKLEQMTTELFEEIGNLKIPAEHEKRKAFFEHLKKACALNKWNKSKEIHSEAQIHPFDAGDSIDPENFSCASYALFKTGELRATEFIFNKDQRNVIRKLPTYLKEWGYQSVVEPKAGDLGFYYLDHNDVPTHVGVYLSSGMIESKLGIINPYISKHKIYDVVSGYGKKVVFLRKG